MPTSDQAAREAAIFLLSERARDHDQKASRAKIATVYVGSTPTHESADEAIKITEQTYLEATVAEALFHQREARRFDDAIDKIKSLDS
jgi:hypothetical protein